MKKTFALTVLIVIFLSACGSPAPISSEAPSTAIVPTDTSVEGVEGTAPAAGAPQPTTIQVPTAGNSWVKDDLDATTMIVTDQGITGWTMDSGAVVTYVWVPQTGNLDVALNASVPTGSSTIEVTVGAVSKTVTLSNTGLQQVYVGSFPIDTSGYVAISMRGIAATTSIIADIPDLFIGGTATQGTPGGALGADQVYFINDPENFYWARRGPSVHLFYQLPTQDPVEWFYSEVTVPAGQDAVGTYAMAAGFSEGYFGIQVNSPTERKVLFSIWSPYQTDDPTNIPEEYRIKLLQAGEGVVTGEFGSEGSGGQSYLPYLWQAGQTYRFLVRAAPVDNDSTVFTGYFYAPENGTWSLIASFRRPQTSKYLTGEYSFLENFDPSAGQIPRQALYGNQWVRTATGQWLEITSAAFSYDNTAAQNWRLDYQGGMQDGQFYLKNCGFFSGFTEYGTLFTRPALGMEPNVDLTKLP